MRGVGKPWETGQLTLADFLPIEMGVVRVKAYTTSPTTPTEPLQGQTTELNSEDIRNWATTKQEIVNTFLEMFNWRGNYADNAVNRRLDRVGKPKNLERLMDVVNDTNLAAAQDSVRGLSDVQQEAVLTDALGASEDVTELPHRATDARVSLELIIRAWTALNETIPETPVLVSPVTKRIISPDEIEKIKTGRLWGAMWFT